MATETPTPQLESRPTRPPLDAASAWQLGLSLVAALLLWGIALAMFVFGLYQRLNPGSTPLGDTPYFIFAAGTALGGCLMLPSATYALLRLLGRRVQVLLVLRGALLPAVAILGLGAALALGNWIAGNGSLSWLLLPPLHLLAVGLPVFLLVYLGVRGIKLGTPQRVWGTFAAGTFLGPLLIFILEALALVLVLAGVLVWASTQPALLSKLTGLASQFQGRQPSPDEIQSLVMPLLANPITIFLVFAFACVIVPLIEEALKSTGVWLLVGRGLTPAAGFAAGVISGAGYALVESLAIGGSGDAWASVVIARMGTAVIHIMTTGMTGWALVLAWRQGRYVRLGSTYLGNVLVHGLWNGLTLLITFNAIPEVSKVLPFPSLAGNIANIAPYGLVALAAIGFIGLIVANRILYWSQPPRPAAETGVV